MREREGERERRREGAWGTGDSERTGKEGKASACACASACVCVCVCVCARARARACVAILCLACGDSVHSVRKPCGLSPTAPAFMSGVSLCARGSPMADTAPAAKQRLGSFPRLLQDRRRRRPCTRRTPSARRRLYYSFNIACPSRMLMLSG